MVQAEVQQQNLEEAAMVVAAVMGAAKGEGLQRGMDQLAIQHKAWGTQRGMPARDRTWHEGCSGGVVLTSDDSRLEEVEQDD